jgi:hypothetical protein
LHVGVSPYCQVYLWSIELLVQVRLDTGNRPRRDVINWPGSESRDKIVRFFQFSARHAVLCRLAC